MIDFIANHQLNIMMGLGSICGIMALFAAITKTITARRKMALLLMELSAMILLYSDRLAYIYRGDESNTGYIMVRVTNYLVFSMTLAVSAAFNLYLKDLVINEVQLEKIPKRLYFVTALVGVGQILVIISQFTGLYYTFDDSNRYQRSDAFVLCYMIPLLIAAIQFTIIIQYYFRINKIVRVSLLMFTILPIVASIVQIYSYGVSLTNMTIVGVAAILYIFVLIDLNNTVEKANELQLKYFEEEQASMHRLFDQTATAFVTAIDAKDVYSQGHSLRVAKYAKKIAQKADMNEEECEEVYYAGLLHDVGRIGIPDSILQSSGTITQEERDIARKKANIGEEILSNIEEYPYLRIGAKSSYENYDGSGYPDKLKGEDIPEIARIIAVADAYDNMTSKSRRRDPLPMQMVREEFIKESGAKFDPKFADIAISIIDDEVEADNYVDEIEEEIVCHNYRQSITKGMRIEDHITRITLKSHPEEEDARGFFIPAVIIFDSLDGRVHDNDKAIAAYKYVELSEIWFDGHSNSIGARNMQTIVSDSDVLSGDNEDDTYSVELGRHKDHLRVVIEGRGKKITSIIVLPDTSRQAFAAFSGERCRIYDIGFEKTQDIIKKEDIPRIVDKTTYINRLQSDIPNLQVNSKGSAATEGILIKDGLRVAFHTMSLPTADLVWHCPHIYIYSSDDKEVEGKNYRKFSWVSLNGEDDGDNEYAHNTLIMKREEKFKGWNDWKMRNKEGIECELTFKRSMNKITMITENLGVFIKHTTTLKEKEQDVYLSLSGDRVALTDIRIL